MTLSLVASFSIFDKVHLEKGVFYISMNRVVNEVLYCFWRPFASFCREKGGCYLMVSWKATGIRVRIVFVRYFSVLIERTTLKAPITYFVECFHTDKWKYISPFQNFLVYTLFKSNIYTRPTYTQDRPPSKPNSVTQEHPNSKKPLKTTFMQNPAP